jgi:hypothetical protein
MSTHSATLGQNHDEPASNLEWRIRGEYLEMPGLVLSVDQASKLWALERPTCQQLLEKLVALKFLQRDHDGRYLRRGDGY